MLNNIKLRTHMMISIGLVAFLAFTITISVVSVKTCHMAKNEALDKALQTAYRYSNIVDAELEIAMDTIRAFSTAMEGVVKHRNNINRDMISEMIFQLLRSNGMFKGIWCVFESNMLDGKDSQFVNSKWHDNTGLYYPYFYKNNGKIQFDACDGYREGDYYQIPKRTGKESIINPYIDVDSGNILMTTVCVPIKNNAKVIGVAGIDIDLKNLQTLVSKIKLYETGYLSIISNNCMYVSHPESEKIGKPIFETSKWLIPYKDAITSGKGFSTETFSKTSGEFMVRICVPLQIGQTQNRWAVMINVPKEKIMEKAKNIMYTAILIGVLSLIVLLAMIFRITHSITTPLLKGVDFAHKMSEGNFTQTLHIHQKDEIGILGKALNRMTLGLGSIFKKVKSGVETLSASSNDLTDISQHMADNAQETSAKAERVNSAALEMNTNMNSVTAASGQALTNLNMVAAATEEMTASISEIAQNAENAGGITANAVSQAKSASDRVNELGNAAMEIGKVTEVITDISEQTNLLALNATIEAARAGNAGKGFAVVAGEIKELAKQTAGATNEIKREIENIQTSISGTVDEIRQISEVNDNVNDIVSTIAAAIEEQFITTKEVSDNIAQASQKFSEVNKNVSQSAAVSHEITIDISEINQATGEMSTNSSQVKDNAKKLTHLAEQLNETIKTFKV